MLAKPNIVPTPEGNIQLEWHTEDADLVVEIADGAYDCYFHDGRGDSGDIYRYEVTPRPMTWEQVTDGVELLQWDWED